MMAGRLFFALKLLLAAAIVWLQAYSLAHAAEHGDEPHEHEGVECELTVFATEDMVPLPAGGKDSLSSPVPDDILREFGTLTQRGWPPERGPQARGPPAQ